MKLVSRSFAFASLVGLLGVGCTLITDVDRSKIGEEEAQAEGGSGATEEQNGEAGTGEAGTGEAEQNTGGTPNAAGAPSEEAGSAGVGGSVEAEGGSAGTTQVAGGASGQAGAAQTGTAGSAGNG